MKNSITFNYLLLLSIVIPLSISILQGVLYIVSYVVNNHCDEVMLFINMLIQ